MTEQAAILLLGPTGAGKSPLGALMEEQGVAGRRCAHFDFGQHLRQVGDGRPTPGITRADRAVVVAHLESGTLLEDDEFHIAAALLGGFLATRELKRSDLLVLNGLPRHVGQARDLASTVTIEAIVRLDATAEVLQERIRLNSGGDRVGRADDVEQAIGARIRRYDERTTPLVDHYGSRGTRSIRLTVGVQTAADDMIEELRGALES